ncbi:hypothetical protein GDO86_007745 [Hymenochirus boettgeri]|uniref:UDP-N-acetylglucosamine transferase subunit ALG14 n=1 Tax=Hymenochirus boettgeri TaxID=247094 RepID=A0A8T2IZ68_9PIPI|nr:hypothetical protein GDO86_007745 [Hymenochirus boettgeri]
MEFVVAAVAGLLLTVVVFALRVCLVLGQLGDHRPGSKGSVSVLVVAGSGGHTTEILRLLGNLSESYSPKHYILAETDTMSEEKIHSFEKRKMSGVSKNMYSVHRIPRSREVRQSWSTSFLTTLQSIFYSFPLTARLLPDLVLCNGPGTCVPVCISAFLLGVFGIKKIIIVYVESICRVDNLSLSGRLIYYFADYFFVQWPSLKAKYPKSVYLGRVV